MDGSWANWVLLGDTASPAGDAARTGQALAALVQGWWTWAGPGRAERGWSRRSGSAAFGDPAGLAGSATALLACRCAWTRCPALPCAAPRPEGAE